MRVKLIRTAKDVDNLIQALTKCDSIGFDTEFEGPTLYGQDMVNVWKSDLVGVSIAIRPDYAYYIPVKHIDYHITKDTVSTIIHSIKEDMVVWMHNAKIDISILKKEKLPLPLRIADSMVAAWLSGKTKPYGLKPILSKMITNVKVESFEEATKGERLSTIPARKLKRYAGLDAIGALMVGQHYYSICEELGLSDWFWNTEMPIMRIIQEMEETGIAINKNKLEKLADKCEREMYKVYLEWCDLAPRKELNEREAKRYSQLEEKLSASLFGTPEGVLNKTEVKSWKRLNKKLQLPIDIGSSHQIRKLYHEGLWDSSLADKTETGLLSTDSKTLRLQVDMLPEGRGRRLAELRLQYQDYQKIRSTYTRSLVRMAQDYDDDRLHGTFHQTGTYTGRFSSSHPNMQNFPSRNVLAKDVLSAMCPSMGNVLISADYSQIELRILAHLSGDENLITAYKEGKDLHQQTAELAGVTRSQAKALGFGIIYGMGPNKLSATLGISKDEAKKFIHKYFTAYPKVKTFMDRMHTYAERTGYTISLAKRRRPIPMAKIPKETKDRDELYKKWHAFRQAFNNPMQGGASDIMKLAMIKLHTALWEEGLDDVKFVSQIHDDLILDVPVRHAARVKHLMKECMESAWELRVPLKVEPKVGHSFAELKDG